MTIRRTLLAAFSTALLLGLAWGCSAADAGNRANPGGGGMNGIGEAGNDEQILSPDGTSPDGGGTVVLNPLCGKARICVPDRPRACASYTPPTTATEPDAPASPGAQAGASGEGGAAGAASSSEAGAGGASGSSAEAGAGAEAGAAGATAAPPPTRFGCQVRRVDGAPQSVVSECAVAGPGAANAPCLTASDCQAGFGCVGDQNSGLCEQYCCQNGDSCASGTYCAERPLRDAVTNARAKGSTDTSSTLLIPVCVPAQNCDLSTPYPCPPGAQCACKAGTACQVVRSDGTTTCATPGTGVVGDACPCAWFHVCSAATNQCLKLCNTRGVASCGDGKCQSSAELPDGWGVCVGGSPSGG